MINLSKINHTFKLISNINLDILDKLEFQITI